MLSQGGVDERCAMQPAGSAGTGHFTYSRIGTHDKSMFGLPVPCQMQCSTGERNEKEGG